MNRKNKIIILLTAVFLLTLPIYCYSGYSGNSKKIGILLVNHGSHSAAWRQALLDVETSVKAEIMKAGKAKGIKTAFMEYTEPSIASCLKQFDNEGFTDIIIIPVFLTVSSHSFDDIPTIIGRKTNPQSLENLKLEKIERYTPKARTYISPLLDFSGLLKENIFNRFKSISKNPNEEGLSLIAYGDKAFDKEWKKLLTETAEYVKKKSGITYYSIGWCGHAAHYSPDSTTAAVKRVLDKKKKVVVIPVLVSKDEMFQIKIIGGGISKIDGSKERVAYKPDSILPDENINNWIIKTADEYAGNIAEDKLK